MSDTSSDRGHLPPSDVIKNSLKAVVQIVALRQAMLGSMSTVWTGSGTIVDPSGLILTNCHVANPRAMGMSAPPADKLAVAIIQRSDEPPALTYFAEIAAQSPELDLAVLRIVSEVNGKPARNLKLRAIHVGDSDSLDLGDVLAIFGYPGIGGDTVTFTSGNVSGFTHEKDISARRAWIKTDATIAGGNSGGTAVNNFGQLVGVPTQASAGEGITPVDARPVVDTNMDGRIDQRDTPMAIGGFINGLRPVNLAKPLLKQAGVSMDAAPAPAAATTPAPAAPARPAPARPAPARPAQPAKPAAGAGSAPPAGGATRGGTRSRPAQPTSAQPTFGNLVFSSGVTRDGRPVNPASLLPTGTKAIFVTFEYANMSKDMPWSQVWVLNSNPVLQHEDKWQDAAKGSKVLTLSNRQVLPDGEYHLVLTIGAQVAAEGSVVVGRRVDDTDSEIAGQVVDAQNGQGIRDALVIALKPEVKVADFLRYQSQDMAYTSVRTDAQGRFTFPQQLPKGQAYGLVVVARGYRDLVVEAGLRVGPQTPEHADMSAIPLQRE